MNDHKKHLTIIGGALTNSGDKKALDSLLELQKIIDKQNNKIKCLEDINSSITRLTYPRILSRERR